jgi:hypothetical protein
MPTPEQRKHYLLSTEVQDIRHRRAAGEPRKAVATFYGVHPCYVSAICHGFARSDCPGPIQGPPRRMSAEQVAEMHRLYGEGWNYRKIAAFLGFGQTTIFMRLAKAVQS